MDEERTKPSSLKSHIRLALDALRRAGVIMAPVPRCPSPGRRQTSIYFSFPGTLTFSAGGCGCGCGGI
jgi:hypothetical protein